MAFEKGEWLHSNKIKNKQLWSFKWVFSLLLTWFGISWVSPLTGHLKLSCSHTRANEYFPSCGPRFEFLVPGSRVFPLTKALMQLVWVSGSPHLGLICDILYRMRIPTHRWHCAAGPKWVDPLSWDLFSKVLYRMSVSTHTKCRSVDLTGIRILNSQQHVPNFRKFSQKTEKWIFCF